MRNERTVDTSSIGSFYIQLLDPVYLACRFSFTFKYTKHAGKKCYWYSRILQDLKESLHRAEKAYGPSDAGSYTVECLEIVHFSAKKYLQRCTFLWATQVSTYIWSVTLHVTSFSSLLLSWNNGTCAGIQTMMWRESEDLQITKTQSIHSSPATNKNHIQRHLSLWLVSSRHSFLKLGVLPCFVHHHVSLSLPKKIFKLNNLNSLYVHKSSRLRSRNENRQLLADVCNTPWL